jgi:hypothetical protein
LCSRLQSPIANQLNWLKFLKHELVLLLRRIRVLG